MSIFRFAFVLPIIGLLTCGVAACGAQPYVLDANEFNRQSVNFGMDPTDITNVTICYKASSTSPDAVRALAINECALFGKTARFIDQNYLLCPLTTPVAANYACDSPPSNTGFGYYPY